MNKIILIDEPEAFLHPTQCKIFGKTDVDYSTEQKGNQIIITTHDITFLSI